MAKTKWIKLDKTLPPRLPHHSFSHAVLITWCDPIDTEAKCVVEAMYRYDTGRWISPGGGQICGSVLAWAYKPEPYEGD